MPTNYSMLKQSEEKLLSMLKEFADHVINTQELLAKNLIERKIDENFISKLKAMEDRSNYYEADIQEECSWIIMRDQPKASHLRYIIAVLNSIKDFERMADYALNIAIYFQMNKLDNDIFNLILDAYNDSLATVKKLIKIQRSMKALEAYDKSLIINDEYRKMYTNSMLSLSKIISKRKARDIANLFSGAVIVLKNIERNVDHIMNVIENFAYIKKSDFFFNLKSTKVAKTKKHS